MVTALYLVYYDTWWQNVITMTKCNKTLLQNVPGFSLQKAIVITKCNDYYKIVGTEYWILNLIQFDSVKIPILCTELKWTLPPIKFKPKAHKPPQLLHYFNSNNLVTLVLISQLDILVKLHTKSQSHNTG